MTKFQILSIIKINLHSKLSIYLGSWGNIAARIDGYSLYYSYFNSNGDNKCYYTIITDDFVQLSTMRGAVTSATNTNGEQDWRMRIGGHLLFAITGGYWVGETVNSPYNVSTFKYLG